MSALVSGRRRAGIVQYPGRHHLLAVPLLAAPASARWVDDAGSAATTPFVIMHGH